MDRRETNALKGIAIVLIVLHNVVHLLCPAAENEFAFSLSNVEFFFSNFPKHPITYILSFYGWIGVSVFVFVSGYGLAAKYSEGKIEVLPWLSSHYIKLFLLLLPCMLALFLSNIATGDFTASDTTRYLLQQLLILNVFSPEDIAPAPYWYLGMALQLYIVFLLIRNVSSKWLAGLGILFYILLAFSPDPMAFCAFGGWKPPLHFNFKLSRQGQDLLMFA